MKFYLAPGYARNVEQIIDKAGKMRDLAFDDLPLFVLRSSGRISMRRSAVTIGREGCAVVSQHGQKSSFVLLAVSACRRAALAAASDAISALARSSISRCRWPAPQRLPGIHCPRGAGQSTIGRLMLP